MFSVPEQRKVRRRRTVPCISKRSPPDTQALRSVIAMGIHTPVEWMRTVLLPLVDTLHLDYTCSLGATAYGSQQNDRYSP